jgi:hypothetical protein
MHAALIELYPSHDECLYSQVRFLKDSGYTVHVICITELKSRIHDINDVDYFYFLQYGKGRWSNLVELFKVRQYLIKNNIKIAVFNTSHGSRIRNLLLMPHKHIRFVGIAHIATKIYTGFTSKLIRLKIKQYFVLNDYILPHLPRIKGVKVSSFYPIFFPPFVAQDTNKSPGEFWVCIPGGMEFKRKDCWALLQGLIRCKLDPRIQFILLGRTNRNNKEIKEFIKKLKDHNLDKHFVMFNEYVSRDTFYSYLNNSDIILPLIHPDKELYGQYIKYKISGTFNLSFGFKIPMLCEKSFSKIEDFKVSSIFYEENRLIEEINSLVERSTELKKKRDAILKNPKFEFEYQKARYINFITSENAGQANP